MTNVIDLTKPARPRELPDTVEDWKLYADLLAHYVVLLHKDVVISAALLLRDGEFDAALQCLEAAATQVPLSALLAPLRGSFRREPLIRRSEAPNFSGNTEDLSDG